MTRKTKRKKTPGKVKRAPNGHWLPGSIPNPDGRPKGSVSIVDEIRRKLVQIPVGEKHTYLELFVQKVFKKALKDEDVSMMKDIISRVDGLPKQTIQLDDPTARLDTMKEYVNKTAQSMGIQPVDTTVPPKSKK